MPPSRTLTQAPRTALAKAKTLGHDGQWAKAAAVYKSVATQPQGEISGEIRRQGMVGQLMAESEAAEREPGEIMGSVLETLRTVLRWLLILALPLALLLLLAGLGRLLRRFPKGGRTSIALIEVVDLDQNAHRDRAVSAGPGRRDPGCAAAHAHGGPRRPRATWTAPPCRSCAATRTRWRQSR